MAREPRIQRRGHLVFAAFGRRPRLLEKPLAVRAGVLRLCHLLREFIGCGCAIPGSRTKEWRSAHPRPIVQPCQPPFEQLDYIYMPSRDVASDVRHFTDVLGAELVFAVDGMGARVAMLSLANSPPFVLLADHVEGDVPDPCLPRRGHEGSDQVTRGARLETRPQPGAADGSGTLVHDARRPTPGDVRANATRRR